MDTEEQAMTDALTLYKDSSTGLDYAGDIGETTPVSWQPRGTLTFDEWLAVGNTFAQISSSINWWVGDWLNYGEKRYGETYSQGMNLTHWTLERLANVKSITRSVKSSLRNELLSWSHHIEVAALEPEEQAVWLNRAEVESWSVRRLREEIKGPQIPPPSLSLSEPDEAPFNHRERNRIPVYERTAVDKYEHQVDGLKHCDDCGNVWMADLPFCPYCNMSTQARIFSMEREKKHQREYALVAANHAVSDDPDYDGDEWYTPDEYIKAARLVMGDIDLDPASCVEAQVKILATNYLTKQEDALDNEVAWFGRVWLNPPYSMPLIKHFVAKLIRQYEIGNTTEAIILTNNSSDTGWFHDLLSRYPACFTRGRVQFWRSDSSVFGARQGQTLFYLGDKTDSFRAVFGQFGQVVIKA
jgi:phage N-6-adenine-methyltransferase